MPASRGGTEGPLWPVCRLEKKDRTEERSQECLFLALGQKKKKKKSLFFNHGSSISESSKPFVLSACLSILSTP